jgi:hypothetical protein
MSIHEVTSIPIRCRFGELTVVAAEAEASTPILNAEESFALRTSVEFLDTSAVALLALEPTIHVEFYAKSCGPGDSVFLGETQMVATAEQRTYSPSLSLRSPANLGLMTDGVYRLGALLRVGAEDGPALICAVQEDVLVQIHALKPEPSKNGKRKASKTSRL